VLYFWINFCILIANKYFIIFHSHRSVMYIIRATVWKTNLQNPSQNDLPENYESKFIFCWHRCTSFMYSCPPRYSYYTGLECLICIISYTWGADFAATSLWYAAVSYRRGKMCIMLHSGVLRPSTMVISF
jgi:hypothetical protein